MKKVAKAVILTLVITIGAIGTVGTFSSGNGPKPGGIIFLQK